MAVTAYLETARVLGLDSVREFALLTLKRLLSKTGNERAGDGGAWDGDQALSHVIAYGSRPGERVAPPEKAPGTLDDYAFTVHACIDGWLASGEMEFYHAAVKLADGLIARFYDHAAGAFNDTAAPEDGGAQALGALTARRKPLQDTPTPGGNPTAASALLRLEGLSGRQEYRQIAEQTLASFAGIAAQLGLYAGSYGLALERLLLDPVRVVIVGSGPQAKNLEALAVARFAVNKTVMRIDPHRLVSGGVPEALAEILFEAPIQVQDQTMDPASAPDGASAAWAIVCRGHTCLPPVTTAEGLVEALEGGD
jgi:uncharacterized protein YyaL (SSP411 family)